MKAIVNVDMNWGIGFNNELLNPIPADLKLFKELTTNNIVVMGLNTFLSLPKQKALPNRTNVVLTSKKDWSAPDVIVCHSIEEVREKTASLSGTVFIIGGSSVYNQFLSSCDTVYVTKVDSSKEADAFFPNLDDMPEWELTTKGEKQCFEDLSFCFTVYTKKL